MLAPRWTSLMWPLQGKHEWDSYGTDVTCTHTHIKAAQVSGISVDWNTDTWEVRMGKDTEGQWSVLLLRMWKHMYSVCARGCLVPFPMNCFNPYIDWEKPVLFPIFPAGLLLFICGAADTDQQEPVTFSLPLSHKHKHTDTHIQGTSVCCKETF